MINVKEYSIQYVGQIWDKSKMRFIPSPVLDDYNTDYFVVFPILNIIIDQVPYKSIFVNKSCYFKTRNQKRK